MRLQPLLLLALVLAPCAAQVREVNFDNYYKLLKSHDIVLIEFYAPWCGHCKEFAPKWEKLAEVFNGRAVLAKVDATEDLELAEEFNKYVQGYPSILLFKKGRKDPVKFDGNNEIDEVADFIASWEGPAVTQLKTWDELVAFRANKLAAVGYFPQGSAKAEREFAAVADALRADYKFAAVSEATALLWQERPFEGGRVAVYVFHASEKPSSALKGWDSKAELTKWLNNAVLPPVSYLVTPKLEGLATNRKLPIVRVWHHEEHNKELRENLNVLAEEYPEKFFFLTYHAPKANWIMKDYSLDPEKDGVCITSTKGRKYCLAQETAITRDTVRQFLEDFLAQKLIQVFKSQPLSEAVTTSGLTVLTGQTFTRDVTENTNRDILIEFYAPWCGHCKQLAPEYEKLAKQLEAVDTVVIAKLDATENEWDKERFPVQGYPTLYFVPAAKESRKRSRPLKYAGERTAEGLLAYLRQHTTHPIPSSLATSDGSGSAPDEL
eukprot:TRINITY_DN3138_c0_g1_i1.p1 TRINITY_DN3138_c0_g1~~TRINITY_DN3138_c0_g1_i1.p1  ORF type:complete len:508 (+),score=117.04 TRINITY_DN3138_c0_g1_i1:47-1525(+)